MIKYLLNSCLLALVIGFQSCSSQPHAHAPAPAAKQQEAKIVFPAQHQATPAGTAYTYDQENIFTPQEIKALDSVLSNFERSNLIPIKVVTVSDASVNAGNFNLHNKEILAAWSELHGNSDKCMAVSISRRLGKVHIDYGPFVQKLLSAAELTSIIETAFNPSFAEKRYYAGTFKGVTALMDTIRKNIRF